jgi:hypothetical protein
MQLKAAIVAPGPAIEADDKRPGCQQRRKVYDPAIAVRHAEIGHDLAECRYLATRGIGGKARNELIVGRLQLRQERARLAKVKFEPFGERGIEAVCLLKGLREGLVERFCLVQKRLPGGSGR